MWYYFTSHHWRMAISVILSAEQRANTIWAAQLRAVGGAACRVNKTGEQIWWDEQTIPWGRAAAPDGRVNCSPSVHRTPPRRRRRDAMTNDGRPTQRRRRRGPGCRGPGCRGATPTTRRCPSSSPPRAAGCRRRSPSRRWTRCSPCRSRTGRTWVRGNRTRSSPAPARSGILCNVRARERTWCHYLLPFPAPSSHAWSWRCRSVTKCLFNDDDVAPTKDTGIWPPLPP